MPQCSYLNSLCYAKMEYLPRSIRVCDCYKLLFILWIVSYGSPSGSIFKYETFNYSIFVCLHCFLKLVLNLLSLLIFFYISCFLLLYALKDRGYVRWLPSFKSVGKLNCNGPSKKMAWILLELLFYQSDFLFIRFLF